MSGRPKLLSWLTKRRKSSSSKQPPSPQPLKATKSTSLVPSKSEYAIEATKKTFDILKGVANLVGIPLVKEVLDIGLSIIAACEAINEVQERVAKLKNRITEFLLVIAKVAGDANNNPMTELSEDLMEELRDLKDCLATIIARLKAITDQNPFLTGLLPQANMETIDDCVTDFQDCIERFQVLRGLHAAQDLSKIQEQLQDIHGLTLVVTKSVGNIETKVDKMQISIDDLKAMMHRSPHGSSYIVLEKMPRLPAVFIGRESVISRIAKQLTSDDSASTRVCILGPGGMGKTSTALAVMQHPSVKKKFAEHHRFWVPCVSANSSSSFLTLLYKHLRITRPAEHPLEAIIAALEESEDPRVILLDNFETSWHPVDSAGQESVKNILRSLDVLSHVAILVTMRSEFPPLDEWICERLPHITLHDSHQIYTTIDNRTTVSPELDGLLQALGHLPYAITLMAKRGKRSFLTPGQLLEEWNKRGTAMLTTVEGGMDHSIRLSIESPLVTQSTDAAMLLQVLSMLPSGIYHNDLNTWVSSNWNSDGLDILRDAALVLTNDTGTESASKVRLFVLPVVQSYMDQHNRIPRHVRQGVYKACFGFLVKHNSVMNGPNHPKFKDDLDAIASQEANLQALLINAAKYALLICQQSSDLREGNSSRNLTVAQPEQLDALLAFTWYQRWTRPRAEIAEDLLILAKKVNDPRREAEALYSLGNLLYQLNRYQSAYNHLQEAGNLFRVLDDEVKGLRSDLKSIDAQRGMGTKPQKCLDLISEARTRWETQSSSVEVSTLLQSYSARLLWHASTLSDEEILLRLQDTKQSLLNLNWPLEVSYCDHWIARGFSRMKRYTEAVEAANEGIQLADLLGLGARGTSGGLHQLKARCLKALDRWDEELLYAMKVAMERAKDSGSPLPIANALVEFGELYVRNEDWSAARVAYEGALKECARGSGYFMDKLVDHCQHNLNYVRMKESHSSEDIIVFISPDRF